MLTVEEPNRYRRLLYLGTLVLLASLGVLLYSKLRSPAHGLEVRAYFADAKGLRPGAPVHLAGVNIGSVSAVRIRPELKDHPAEVVMVLNPGYELPIPQDATVSLETAGLLGETFPQIDIKSTSGPPIADQGVLKAVPTESMTPQQVLDRLAGIAQKQPPDTAPKKQGASK